MPAQLFRTESEPARMVWDFAYKEMFLEYEGRTFQLHNVEQLRSDGVRISVSKKEELFVYLARTRDGERFQVTRNGEQLESELIEYGISYNGVSAPLKVTANVAQPGKGKWKLQTRVEAARLWCRGMAAVLGGVVAYIALSEPNVVGVRRNAAIGFAIAAVVLLLCDMMSKWDTGARYWMFLPPFVILYAAYNVVMVYLDYRNQGEGLQSPHTVLAFFGLIALAFTLKQTLEARSAASTLCIEAKEHKKLHPRQH